MADIYATALGTNSAEAFAAGCAIVAPLDGQAPMRGRIVHERNGLVTVFGHAPSLAPELRRAAGDSELRKRLVSGARDSALFYHGIDSVDRWEVSMYRLAVMRAIASR
eukprot:Opistho-2@60316